MAAVTSTGQLNRKWYTGTYRSWARWMIEYYGLPLDTVGSTYFLSPLRYSRNVPRKELVTGTVAERVLYALFLAEAIEQGDWPWPCATARSPL